MRWQVVAVFMVLLTACTDADRDATTHRSSTANSTKVPPISDSVRTQTGPDLYDIGVNSDSVTEVDRFIVLGLRRFGDSLEEVVRTLGPADSIVAEPFANRHVPGQIDSTVTAFFKTARVSLYKVTNGREIVTNITVYDNSFLLMPTVRIGDRWEDVIARLGEPHFKDEIGFRWSCSACVVNQQLVVQVAGGRISSVGFAYYIG
jgi:hypothetical protein